MYAFARRPRWVLVHVVLLVVVALFAVAGFWQLQRLSERRQQNALVGERREQPVGSLGSLWDRPDAAEQRRVRVEGRYDAGRELILIGRSNGGPPGNHVLTPLVISGGRAIVVDRGWVPADVESPRDPRASLPDRVAEVTGVLIPSEGSGPLGGNGKLADVISRIDVARIARSLPYETFPLYLALKEQDPPQPGGLPKPVKLTELGAGPHLLYAIQWFCFIPIALVGYASILRREARRSTPTQMTTASGS